MDGTLINLDIINDEQETSSDSKKEPVSDSLKAAKQPVVVLVIGMAGSGCFIKYLFKI
jgi:hypothetical protein